MAAVFGFLGSGRLSSDSLDVSVETIKNWDSHEEVSAPWISEDLPATEGDPEKNLCVCYPTTKNPTKNHGSKW